MDNSNKLEAAIELIDSWLSTYTSHKELPSVSVGIVQGNDLVFAKSYGYANIEEGKLAATTTNYRVGSVSKSFTAVSILQLAEKGQLKLDDPVHKYLDWFTSGLDESLEKITIRQLMSHSAGIRREIKGFVWDTRVFPSDEELKEIALGSIVSYEPLETFKYSNLGFAILGKVVEEISGISYAEYVRANIFEVLDMNNSNIDEGLRDANIAQGYDRKITGFERKAIDYYETSSFHSAAGVNSNVEDLSKYISALVIGSGKLLSDFSKREMQRVQYSRKGETESYGLGVVIDIAVDGHELVRHDGAVPGFEAEFAFDKTSGLVVVVLINASETPKSVIVNEIFKTIKRVEENLKPSDKDVSKYQGMFSSLWTASFVPIKGNVLYYESFADKISDFKIMTPVADSADSFTNGEVEGYFMPGENINFVFDGDSIEYVDYGGYKLIPHELFVEGLVASN